MADITANFPSDADIARLRYENAYVALLERSQRAEAALAEQADKHDKAVKELLRQISELRKTLTDYEKAVERVDHLESLLEEKNEALGAMYNRLRTAAGENNDQRP